MREAKVLDLSGSWEDIVNNVDRHNARVKFDAKLRARKLDKMKQWVINLSLCAVLVIALGFSGLVHPGIAIPVAVLLVCAASVMGGRLLEARRK